MSDTELLGRYVLERKLGVGGYGEVYAAFDKAMARRVALKRMRSFFPEHLLRFKREFRALAGISHPNLVCLYDLFTDRGDYYLSMELVEGVPLVSYVRSASAPDLDGDTMETCDAPLVSAETKHSALASLRASRDDGSLSDVVLAPLPSSGFPRVRSVFSQLADALGAMHSGGMVHRDLKPSNVLVTPEGRVVVLDFGLVTEIARDRPENTRSMLGTPYYMSPEQANADTITSAADLYSVGVMLYECLLGTTPFEGMTALQAIVAKVSGQIDDVRTNVPGIPDDLADLCRELLAVDPASRPLPSAMRHRLARSELVPDLHVTPSRGMTELVGRDQELAELRAVHAAIVAGSTGFAVLEGESGMGKSALADHFLEWADDADRAVVVRGRCYEHDALPNKLVDSVIDSLSAHLSRLPESLLRGIVPHEIAELVRVFPVLGRIDEIADRSPLSAMRDDPREARRFAELAFAELLARLGEICPVVVYIDDVHWGDVESLGFLRALLDPKASRRVMVLLACRAEEKLTSPLLRALFGLVDAGEVAKPNVVEIGRLSVENAEALALALANDSRGARLAAMVAKEGRGHPLFIEELVRYVRASETTPRVSESEESTGDLGSLLLSDVIVRRVRGQSAETVRMLEALAVVGVPIAPRVVFRAAGLPEVDGKMLHRLRAEHLVRRSGAEDDGLIVCYHDRIRESLISRLEPEARRVLHRAIAEGLELEPNAPASLLATHHFGAGDRVRAAEQAFRAGEHALGTLAFGEAATFFGRALQWDETPSERRTRTSELLGDALFNLGRCREAADAYLDAATERGKTDARAALRLRTRAAEANLMGGDDERGEPMMRAVLAEVGVSFPESELMMKLRIGWNLVRLGTNLPTPLISPKPTKPATLDKIDVLYAAQRSYLLRDFPRSMIFSMEGFREALTIGDAPRLMEGVALYAAASSIVELRGAPLVMQASFDLAEKLGTDFAHGMAHLARGLDLFGRQLLRESYTHLHKSVELLGRCAGITPIRIHAEAMEILLLRCLEDFATLRTRSDEIIRAARTLGNPYVEAVARHDSCVADLGADRPGDAIESIEAARAAVSTEDLYVVYSALHYRVKCHRYVGEWDKSLELMDDTWKELVSRNLLANSAGKLTYGGLRTGSLVGLAAQEPRRRAALVRRARSSIAPFKKVTSEWGMGYRGLLEGAIASLEGNPESAFAHCKAAADALDLGRLPVFAESARFRAAQVAKDGVALANATHALRGLGVVNPGAWVDSVAPGFV